VSTLTDPASKVRQTSIAPDRASVAPPRLELSAEVYEALHRLAARYLNRERPDHTLQPTALVNETWLRLARGCRTRKLGRAAYYRAAALAMRHILVNHARDRSRLKRGGGAVSLALHQDPAAPEAGIDLLVLDESLNRLHELDERKARLVELRYFGGLDVRQTALAMGLSPSTVKRDWALARAWLLRELRETDP